MLNMQYNGDTDIYPVSFRRISNNLVQIKGDMPIRTVGFTLFSMNDKSDKKWDYSDYVTVYREIEGGVEFSNIGIVYIPCTILPPPKPYIPSLDEIKETKIAEMNAVQQSVIHSGIDVRLTAGTVEHFTLTEHDQTSLMGLQTQVAQGMDNIPWHTSDQGEHCKYYNNADMALIVTAAMSYVTYHVTYFRDLRIYIRSLDAKEDVEAIDYGTSIPEEYQSEPLRDMLAQIA